MHTANTIAQPHPVWDMPVPPPKWDEYAARRSDAAKDFDRDMATNGISARLACLPNGPARDRLYAIVAELKDLHRLHRRGHAPACGYAEYRDSTRRLTSEARTLVELRADDEPDSGFALILNYWNERREAEVMEFEERAKRQKPMARPSPAEIIADAKERGIRLAPGSSLPQYAEGQLQVLRDRARAKREAFAASGGWCIWPCCTRRAVDPHHIHSAGQGGANDAENIAPLCREHHDECVSNRPLAESLGFVVSGHRPISQSHADAPSKRGQA